MYYFYDHGDRKLDADRPKRRPPHLERSMLNRLFGLKQNGNASPANGHAPEGSGQNGSGDRGDRAKTGPAALKVVAKEVERNPVWLNPPSFEQIYQTAGVKPPKVAYGILKVADMVNSPHLAGMSVEFKRNALMMALEAAGAEVGDVLQDVVIRQRALNDFEESLQEKVRQFEASQAEQNRLQQEELDRLTSQYMARIQANLDEVARSQDCLRAWQRQKHQELQRLTEAAAFCVPQGTGALEAVSSMVPVQERAAATRR